MAINYGTKLIAFIGCGLIAFSAVAETLTIAATVNDEVITSLDVAERRALLMANNNLPDTAETQQRLTPRVIQMLVDEALQMQEAKRQGVKVTDEETEAAIDNLGAPQAPKGAVRAKIQSTGLSMRTVTRQVQAQLSWNKVMRKLRRNISITQDELTRAQQFQAAAPGAEELRIAVLAIAVPSPQEEAAAAAIANEVKSELASGRDFPAIAEKYRDKPNVQFNPLLWVNEERSPPELFTKLKAMKPGEQIGPERTGPVIQFVKLFERRVTKKAPSTTEVLVKQITIDAPSKTDKVMTAKLAESEKMLRANPGSCDGPDLPTTPIPARAEFARVKLGALTAEQQTQVSRMDVGTLSDTRMLADKLQMILLCERSESQGAAVIDESLRQELFNEKMELESQKQLRDLRRQATIDVRGQQ